MPFLYPEYLDALDAMDALTVSEQDQVTQPWGSDDDGDLSSITHVSENSDVLHTYDAPNDAQYPEDPEDDTYPPGFSDELEEGPDAYRVDSAVYEFVEAVREDMTESMVRLVGLFPTSSPVDDEDDDISSFTTGSRRDSPWPYAAQPMMFSIDDGFETSSGSN
jgi:hypothetical protein